MSKMDAQRAMREAKYARQQAAAPARRPRLEPPVAPPAAAGATQAAGEASTASTATGTCGHKSMNGRACTRPAGHTEKSHRYA